MESTMIDLPHHVLYFETDKFSIRSKESNSMLLYTDEILSYMFVSNMFIYTFNYTQDGGSNGFKLDSFQTTSMDESIYTEDSILSEMTQFGLELSLDMFTIDMHDVVTFFNPKSDITDLCITVKNRMDSENFNIPVHMKDLYLHLKTDDIHTSRNIISTYMEHNTERVRKHFL